MTTEQQTFVVTLVQVLPTLFVALAVFHWQESANGFRVRHKTKRQARRFVAWAWLLYGLLPFASEIGLIVSLLLPALGRDAGWLPTAAIFLSFVSVFVILLALCGFIAAMFAKQSTARKTVGGRPPEGLPVDRPVTAAPNVPQFWSRTVTG